MTASNPSDTAVAAGSVAPAGSSVDTSNNAAEARSIALRIVTTPSLRTQFFQDPQAALKEAVPLQAPPLSDERRKERVLRGQVMAEMPDAIKNDPEAATAAHAEAVMRQFFDHAIKNPETTFRFVLALSTGAFIVGALLIIAASYVGLRMEDGQTETAIVAGVLGGGGVISLLGSLFSLAKQGLSTANANDTQMRLILTTFATEMGRLRAMPITDQDQLEWANQQLQDAMVKAVALIQENVKVDPGVAPAPAVAETKPAPVVGASSTAA